MLAVITTENGMQEEAQILNRMFDEGLELLHLRKPRWTEDQFDEYLQELDPSFLQRVRIHYQPQIALKWNLGGLHVSLMDGSENNGFRVSSSAHSWEEINQLADQREYLFLSPFYDSISKKGYEKQSKLWEKDHWNHLDQVIALGGISKDNLEELMSHGFKGVAVLGSVWNPSNPFEQWQELNDLIKKCKDQRP